MAVGHALVKVEAQGLPHFTFGDSKAVKKGDWVMALGHPGGPYPDVQPAFAAGRVIDLERKLPVGMMSKYYNHAIVTDVPIYAGDSGGPLIDEAGQLVGINGAIVMINELAFAIPIHQILADLYDWKGISEGVVPTYPSGLWTWSWAGNGSQPTNPARELPADLLAVVSLLRRVQLVQTPTVAGATIDLDAITAA